MIYYSRTLGAPATGQKADSQVIRAGFKVFNKLKCSSCHIAKQQTGFNSNEWLALLIIKLFGNILIFLFMIWIQTEMMESQNMA